MAEKEHYNVIVGHSGVSGGKEAEAISGVVHQLNYDDGLYLEFTGTLTANTDIELDNLEGFGLDEKETKGRIAVIDCSAINLAGYTLTLSGSATVNGVLSLTISRDIYKAHHKSGGNWIAYSITGNFASAGQILQIRIDSLGGGADRYKVDFNNPTHATYCGWTALRATPTAATWTTAAGVEDTMIVGLDQDDILVPIVNYTSIADNVLQFSGGISVNSVITLRQTAGGVITFVP